MSNSELPRTDWLDLAVMSQGDSEYEYEWGSILDEENFQRLDRETMLSGPYADRPEKAPHDGSKYHATDLNAVFSWDADTTEWNVLNSGTAEDPVPGERHLDSVRAKYTDSGQVNIGSGSDITGRMEPRDFVTNEEMTLSVPSNFDTIQGALNKVPHVIRHQVTVEIDPAAGPYDEDLIVPAVISDSSNESMEGPSSALRIESTDDGPNGTNVEIGSLLVTNAVGCNAIHIRNLNVTSPNPWDNENSAFGLYGSGNVLLYHCGIGSQIDSGNGNAGVVFGVTVKIKNFDFGTDLVDDGFTCKTGGKIQATSTSGSVLDELWNPAGGPIHFDGDNSASAGTDLVRTATSSQWSGYDYSNCKTYAWEHIFNDSLRVDDTAGISTRQMNLSIDTGDYPWEIRTHDAGDGNPEGTYEWDPNNHQWVGLGNASGTTISP